MLRVSFPSLSPLRLKRELSGNLLRKIFELIRITLSLFLYVFCMKYILILLNLFWPVQRSKHQSHVYLAFSGLRIIGGPPPPPHHFFKNILYEGIDLET